MLIRPILQKKQERLDGWRNIYMICWEKNVEHKGLTCTRRVSYVAVMQVSQIQAARTSIRKDER